MMTAAAIRPAVEAASRAAAAERVPIAICAAGELWGGVEQFVVTLGEGLQRTRFLPIVAVFHDALLAGRLRERGIEVYCVGSSGKYSPRSVAALRALLMDRRIRLLHVHGYKATLTAVLARRGIGIPILKTEHGLLEPLESWRDLGQFARLAANTLLDRAASRVSVDARVFVSREIRRRLHVSGSSGRVIYNGV